MAREFEERDHPPVLAIIGPLPWFAPLVLTNDAAVITELVRRSNRRIQTPRLIPRSNSSGNLQVRFLWMLLLACGMHAPDDDGPRD